MKNKKCVGWRKNQSPQIPVHSKINRDRLNENGMNLLHRQANVHAYTGAPAHTLEKHIEPKLNKWNQLYNNVADSIRAATIFNTRGSERGQL